VLPDSFKLISKGFQGRAAWGFHLFKPYSSRAAGKESLSITERHPARERRDTSSARQKLFSSAGDTTHGQAAEAGHLNTPFSGEPLGFAYRAPDARLARWLAGAQPFALHTFNTTATGRFDELKERDIRLLVIQTLRERAAGRETFFHTWQKN
jgi:hypothetical protein